MLAAITLASLATVSAFAPAGRVASSALKMAEPFAGGLAGADGPELKKFDPLKFSSNSPEWVPFFREAELKHGRIAMLAVVGIIGATGVRLPGDIYTAGTVLDAHNNAVANGPMWQLLFWISLIELISSPAVAALGTGDRAPGDFSFDPLGLGKVSYTPLIYSQSRLT